MPKQTKWFYPYQKLFSQWLKDEDLKANCLKQAVGVNTVTEEYQVYPATGGRPTYVKYTITRLTRTYITVYVEKGGNTITLI